MDLQTIGDNILVAAVYATLLIRLRFRFRRLWDIPAAVLGTFGAGVSIAGNVEAGVGWTQTVLVAVLLLLMPFAAMSLYRL